MAFQNPTSNPLFLFTILLLVSLTIHAGFGAEDTVQLKKGSSNEGLSRWPERGGRRLMIGSTAPTCTYNECRGCRFKCSAEQVPVDANDPVNSAYHYRCVCHR